MSTYVVKSVAESPAGFSVTVCVLPASADDAELPVFLISPEFWEWGRLAADAALTEDDYARMEHHAALSRAVARVKSILSYSGHSRADLLARLRRFDFSEEIAAEAADYAVRTGLIREQSQAERIADVFLHRKYWGKRRIRAELASRGYPSEVIDGVLDGISDEECLRALRRIIKQKYGTPPSDPGERQRMILSLLRLGYSGGEIKEAIAALEPAAT